MVVLDCATEVEARPNFADVADSLVEVCSMNYHTPEAVRESLYEKLDYSPNRLLHVLSRWSRLCHDKHLAHQSPVRLHGLELVN